jgi:hypothetical protein
MNTRPKPHTKRAQCPVTAVSAPTATKPPGLVKNIHAYRLSTAYLPDYAGAGSPDPCHIPDRKSPLQTTPSWPLCLTFSIQNRMQKFWLIGNCRD